MRVQHNIMAMNSYRNYSNNVKALSGNLEKLSSGYKINRAGDDAAGLAISEKMRAQITGLNAAQKNVKDGISLVKTAEGAMQEIQDMLNRMDYLATQSANGTYQNEVDRENLQKEVTALKTEINRIADSANFNGIKLLDGSLSGGGAGVAQVVNLGGSALTGPTEVDGAKEKDTITFGSPSPALEKGDKVTVSTKYINANGATISKEYSFTVASGGTKLLDAEGTEYANLGTAVQEVLKKDGADSTFDFSDADATKLVAEAKEKGSNAGRFIQADVTVNGTPQVAGANVTRTVVGKDKVNEYSGFAPYKGASGTKAEDFIFTVNGAKFAFATEGNSGAFSADVNVVTLASDSLIKKDVKEMMLTINRVLGGDVARLDSTGTNLQFLKDASGGKGGLRLQIGDTADSYNQMMVKVGNMHTGALGIAGVDISTQDGAAAAIAQIKNAINQVSSVRGDLGAIQNRLDHTANNLSVMAENIQDAESTIRDTDVAEEMMSYVKNNILVQSAQAMLAQANQVPQGVLQLLG